MERLSDQLRHRFGTSPTMQHPRAFKTMSARWPTQILSTLYLLGTCFLISPAWASRSLTAEELACGTFQQTGRLDPQDYRKPDRRLQLVEEFHFGPASEALVRPMQRGGTFGGDIDYTLWGYPNHHRALVSLVRLGERLKTDKPPGAQFTIDCYFRRALRFTPDDLIVRMIYANYLGSVRRRDDAMRQLAFVTSNAGENAFTHYNAGLAYLQLGAWEEARAQAKQAREMGFPLPNLIDGLRRVGRWSAADDAEAAASPVAPASDPAVPAGAASSPAKP